MLNPRRFVPAKKYPIWVIPFVVSLLAITVYAITIMPGYFVAARNLDIGINFYKDKRYVESIKYLEKVLDKYPTSRKAKLAIAKAYLVQHNPEGLKYIRDLKLDKKEFADLKQVMPSGYEQYFKTGQ